jgi:hypothetical protein
VVTLDRKTIKDEHQLKTHQPLRTLRHALECETTGRPDGFALGFLDGKTARLAKVWPNGQ